MACHMCGIEDDFVRVCNSCLNIACNDCAKFCTVCSSFYCDQCNIDKILMLRCSNREERCDNIVCYKCYESSENNYVDTFFCDECKKDTDDDVHRYSFTANEYVIFNSMNPEKNKKRRRISKDDSFYYDCQEQGPNLVYGVIDLMFSFVSDRDKLLKISLVCKHYRNVLMNNTDIWMNGDGQSVVTQREKMLFIHNIPTTKIRFPIQCLGLSLKIINYLLRNNQFNKDLISH